MEKATHCVLLGVNVLLLVSVMQVMTQLFHAHMILQLLW